MKQPLSMDQDSLHRFLLAAVLLLLSVSFGLSYGISTHSTYLLDGLVRIDPDFLQHDWLATETTHYHSFFWIIVKFAAFTGSIGWCMAFFNCIVILASFWIVYRLNILLAPEEGKPAIYFLVCFVLIDQTLSVGYSALQGLVLQPSSLGALFTLGALFFFVKGRFLPSGILLAIAGFFHTNYLVLGFPFFGLAHLLLGYRGLLPRLVRQHGFSLVLFSIKLPFLLNMAKGSNAELARHIFLFVRSPHHYVPMTYLNSFLPLVGWAVLGFVSLYSLRIENELRQRVRAFYLSLVIILFLATFLTTVIFMPVVSQLFFWRFAPFCVLLGKVFFILYCLERFLSEGDETAGGPFWKTGIMLAGLALIARYYTYTFGWFDRQTIYIGVGLFSLFVAVLFPWSRFVPNQSYRRTGLVVFLLAWFAVLSPWVFERFIENSSLLNGFPGQQRAQLYAWAKTSTTDSRFMVVPDMQYFRIQSGRAVVVDWKSTPIDPDGLVEWYRRICALAGKDEIKNLGEALTGYSNMTSERLVRLRDQYKIDFAVFYREKQPLKLNQKVAFSNDKYVVLKL